MGDWPREQLGGAERTGQMAKLFDLLQRCYSVAPVFRTKMEFGQNGCVRTGKMRKAAIESDGTDVFVVYNGVRIATRGQPGTPQDQTWVSLEPGYAVWDKGYPQELVIEYEGKVVSSKNVHGG